MAKHKTLSLKIRDTSMLLAVYMPFVEHGGIFVPTKEHYQLGEEVLLSLTLPEEQEEIIEVGGRVAWISPLGVSGRRIPGIGVHFHHESQNICDRIETLLAGKLDRGTVTYTL
ncbi:PilZ domain-containing protein [Pistricoccus aurantiacus]|uniref:PilZ domain-containing protein n=1 Tax=Pistricoccus aurantiacus TaxID=1883414 RepID=UPI00362784E0